MAPQLGPTYAQYDNGASVFPFYDNFAGTSLPSGWQTQTSTVTGTVNNGITITNTVNNGAGIAYSTSTISAPYIIEDYYSASGTSGGNPNELGGIGLTSYPNGSNTPYLYYGTTGFYNGSYQFNNIVNGTWQTPSGTYTTNTWYIMTFENSGAGTIYQVNYGSNFSKTSSTYPSAEYILLPGSIGMTVYIKWVRARAYPPSGTAPTNTLGTINLVDDLSFIYAIVPIIQLTYTPIRITNTQSTATPAPFQQMIQINTADFTDIVFNTSTPQANFEFFSSVPSQALPAWIESYSNGILTIWVSLPNGI